MNCELTDQDCKEIYQALGCAHARTVQLHIGYDGERLAKGEVDLSRSEASAIYQALLDAREHIFGGAYDAYPGEVKTNGSVTFELLARIEGALVKIGYLGENLLLRSYAPLKTA